MPRAVKNGGVGGGSSAKPRGKTSAYAYFVSTCREEHKKKYPDETVVFAEFSRKCADSWRTMTDKEKRRFQEMAEADKKRYEREMANYVPPKDGEKVGRGKKAGKVKKVKDPNAPKRPLTAFFLFCNDKRPGIKSDNPDFKVGDVAKELGRLWSECGSDMKAKYEAKAKADKVRYEKQLAEYQNKVAAQAADEDDDDDEEEEMDSSDSDE